MQGRAKPETGAASSLKAKLAQRIEHAWYETDPFWLIPFRPLGWLVARIAHKRLERFKLVRSKPDIPVIVVGNITVGGSGKTPFVIALAKALQQRGYAPGVISRGYGAHPKTFPWHVQPEQSATEAGDEPLMIASETGLPVVIDPDRKSAMDSMLATGKVNLVIADDGLQHFALPRTFEIVVLDSLRGLGNGRCIPAGPLREPADRIQDVDALVYSGLGAVPDGAFHVWVNPEQPLSLMDNQPVPWPDLLNLSSSVHAVAGIANPERFFDMLEQQGFTVIRHVFADHHSFEQQDIQFGDGLPIVMTSKDAVKCRSMKMENAWYVPVSMSVPIDLVDEIIEVVGEPTVLVDANAD